MKLEELLARTSLKAISRRLGLDVRPQTDFYLPSMKMVEACRADDFDFFQPFIDAGKLTVEQMHHAAARYHLGKTKSGQPIFWMIDDNLDPLDAHIVPDTWISTLLKRREPMLEYWYFDSCLFGLHLLKAEVGCKRDEVNSSVCIVESERSAVVLSELFPNALWLASSGLQMFSVEMFQPLTDYKVVIFPDTDVSGDTYRQWQAIAQEAQKRFPFRYPLRVSALLESHATPEQKQRKIDIADFLLADLA